MSRPDKPKSDRLQAMRPGQGRVRAPKQLYREPHFETVVLLDGRLRRVMKDGCVRSKLHQIIVANGRYKSAGPGELPGLTSGRTQQSFHEGLGRLFDVLLERYPIKDPANIDGRHLQYLYDWMEGRLRNGESNLASSLCSATIAQYVSYLRRFCGWIGQSHVIELAGVRFESDGVTSRSMATTVDKSWEGRGLDIGALIDAAYLIEPWVGIALLYQHAFGLRRKEVICSRPTLDWDRPGHVLHVRRGAKGGRPRVIPIREPWQAQCLAGIQDWLRREGRIDGYIGGVCLTLRQNLDRYKNVLIQLGVTRELVGTTGHGLRHGSVCRTLALLGVVAPVRGGDLTGLDPEVIFVAYTGTTESTGHSRHWAVHSYAGRPGCPVSSDRPPLSELPDVDKVLAKATQRQQEQLDLDKGFERSRTRPPRRR